MLANQGFGLEKFFDAEIAQFTAIAGLLVAAEGGFVVPETVIDIDLSGADLACQVFGVGLVF